jgi:hypothetical protein
MKQRFIQKNVIRLILIAVYMILSNVAFAAIIHDELTEGDLPSYNLLLGPPPTTADFGPFGPGSYTFTGSISLSNDQPSNDFIIDDDVISFTTTDRFTIDVHDLSGITYDPSSDIGSAFAISEPTPLGDMTPGYTGTLTNEPVSDIWGELLPITSTYAGDWYLHVFLADGLPSAEEIIPIEWRINYSVTINVSPVPIPASVWLFGTALLSMLGWRVFSLRQQSITAINTVY